MKKGSDYDDYLYELKKEQMYEKTPKKHNNSSPLKWLIPFMLIVTIIFFSFALKKDDVITQERYLCYYYGDDVLVNVDSVWKTKDGIIHTGVSDSDGCISVPADEFEFFDILYQRYIQLPPGLGTTCLDVENIIYYHQNTVTKQCISTS